MTFIVLCLEQATGYVGGSVWALEWCPLGHATVNRQVLAVASSKDVCWGPALSRISDGPCSIQFWDAGSLDGREYALTDLYISVF